MLLARMHPAMTWAKVKTGPPATPNVVAVAIATTVVTAAAMNAPTMLSRAILLSVVSHGPTGAMTADQIRKQVEYLVSKGWNPAIEHIEPEYLMDSYWYMWKLPMFGETDVTKVLAEAEACHKANPNNHVRLIGYNNFNQSQGAAMVIFRGKTV